MILVVGADSVQTASSHCGDLAVLDLPSLRLAAQTGRIVRKGE